jgi:hypothetical protein
MIAKKQKNKKEEETSHLNAIKRPSLELERPISKASHTSFKSEDSIIFEARDSGKESTRN